ncbi:uncharacterized protein LOC123894346 [Trifolium pratense]|uniref:uncharacterized protein LOC123894346 n=1 Tax=Trifolium pratense TaxID=57577 RepID=UPI001E695B61|nr:uncharacterized protein LOC123894346 [Trifolium pratense]
MYCNSQLSKYTYLAQSLVTSSSPSFLFLFNQKNSDNVFTHFTTTFISHYSFTQNSFLLFHSSLPPTSTSTKELQIPTQMENTRMQSYNEFRCSTVNVNGVSERTTQILMQLAFLLLICGMDLQHLLYSCEKQTGKDVS